MSQATAPTSVLARHTLSTRLRPLQHHTPHRLSPLDIQRRNRKMSAVSLDAARWAASAVVLLDIGEYSVHAAALESRVDGDQPPWATSQPLPCIQPRCAGLALESLVARNRRSRCFAAIVLLPQTWLTPQVALPSTAPSVRDPTQNEANHTISSQREPFQAFRLSRM